MVLGMYNARGTDGEARKRLIILWQKASGITKSEFSFSARMVVILLSQLRRELLT